jgi:hypothetical protein
VGDCKSTQLWDDVWILSSPLRIQYPRLYAICDDPEISVVDCAAQGWQINFRRMMGPAEFAEWTELSQALGDVVITGEAGVVS